MSNILWRYNSKTNIVDIEADQLCHKKGMAVAVRPFTHSYGSGEAPPKFISTKVIGFNPQLAERLLLPQYNDDNGNPYMISGKLAMFRRCEYALDIFSFQNNLPINLQEALADFGRVTVTIPQISPYIKRISDGALFEGYQ